MRLEWSRVLVALCSAMLLTWCGCSGRGSSEGLPQSPESKYIRNQNNNTVIVFVHGITGDAISTWTNTLTHGYWPAMLMRDPTFHNTDIYVFSYKSPVRRHAFTVDELIDNMKLILDHDKVFTSHQHVVFLCHSMGGLLVRGYITRYQDKAAQVRLIYFFATPTTGSHIAMLGKLLSNNPQFHAVLPAGSNSFTTSLEKNWRGLAVHPYSRCAYETETTYGIQIVDAQSASALCDGTVDPMESDHIQIVKPADSKDLPYIAFQEAFSNPNPNDAGVIRVNSQMSGDLYIDGGRVARLLKGETREFYGQSPGKHRVELKGKGQLPQPIEVSIENGKVAIVSFNGQSPLIPHGHDLVGTLRVDSVDGVYGDVYVDNVYKGYLDRFEYLMIQKLPVGKHTYRVTGSAESQEQPVEIKANQTTILYIRPHPPSKPTVSVR